MKFRELLIWKSLPTEPNRDPFFFSENFDHEDEINALFKKLAQFDDEKISSEKQQELLFKEAPAILEQCDALINKHTLVQDPQWSNAIIAALSGVKMQIHLRQENGEQVRNQYDNFVRASSSILSTSYQMTESEQDEFTGPLARIAREATQYLLPTISINPNYQTQKIPVPDILAAATFVSDSNLNLNDIRKTWQQLWKVEAIQPLLNFAAHATQGWHCNHKGEVTNGETLQIILVNSDLTRPNAIKFSGFCAGKNLVMVSIGNNNTGKKTISQDYGSILAHELHHYFEESFYQSNQLFPYVLPEKTWQQSLNPFNQDPNSEIKTRLDKMWREAHNIDKKFDVKTLTFVVNGMEIFWSQPSSTFLSLQHYPESKGSERIRHAEIVVRVSEALSNICQTTNCDSETGLQRLRDAGLEECVKFFNEEKQLMINANSKMGQQSGVSFSDDLSSLNIIPSPPYLDYRCQPLHDAVYKSDIQKLRNLLAEKSDTSSSCLEKDSLNQSALDLAISQNNHEMVFEFCSHPEIFKEVTKDLILLHKTALHLAHLAQDETSEFSEKSLALFRSMQIPIPFNDRSSHVRSVIANVRFKFLDELIKDKTTEEIITLVDQGQFNFRDRFGNVFYDHLNKYVEKQEEREKIINYIKEKYEFFFDQEGDQFSPRNPLREILLYGGFYKFLKILAKPEITLDLLQQKLNIPPIADHSAIEIVAANCNSSNACREWFEIFKKIVHDHKIDPHQKINSTTKSLVELLPESYANQFAKTSVKEKTAIPETSPVSPRITKSESTQLVHN